MQKVKVAIIGAGTAGLSAFKEVRKQTDSVVLIDHGPLGTTCARVGCMPSEVLIQVAHDFHRRHVLAQQGIYGGEKLQINIPEALAHVRKLRDYFVASVLKGVEAKRDFLVEGTAEFIAPQTIKVNGKEIHAEKIIIATGSRSVVLPAWESFADKILTSDTIFEQQDLPKKMAVIGTGVIGLELGQALAHLGVEVTAFGRTKFMGGLTDPVVADVACEILATELNLKIGSHAQVAVTNEGLLVKADTTAIKVDKVLAAMGRRPDFSRLNLAAAGIELNQNGMPNVSPITTQVDDQAIFMIGDAMKTRPLLHEAADEGRIAGYNAVRDKVQCFKRRARMHIVFTQPNIAVVGQPYQELQDNNINFHCGEVSFSDQGRARVKIANAGHLRVYVETESGKLLGAEMIAPDGEHLAHLLAWAIQQQMTVFDILRMPYYHPVVEEGMRTALRDAAQKVCQTCQASELAMCDSAAASGLS